MIKERIRISGLIIIGMVVFSAPILFLTTNYLQTEVSAQRSEDVQEIREANDPDAPQACNLNGTIGIAPAGGSTGNFPNIRLNRDAVQSQCTVPAKAYPGTLTASSRPFNVHNITNTSSSPACITFTLTNLNPVSDVFLSVHKAPFTATDISDASKYLGDSGSSVGTLGSIITFQTVIPANTNIALVVTTAGSSITGTAYSIDVSSTFSGLGTICGVGTGIKSYTGSAVPIPDATTAGTDVDLPVSGIGRIRDLNFVFQTAGVCDATVGNTNAAVDHTFIGDLTFKLTSPQGTTVTFQANRGGTRENICDSTLDDEFGLLLSSITSVTGSSMSGNFQPETTGRFNLFRGENADGIWKLNVSDAAGVDTGNLRRFALNFTNSLYPSNDFNEDGKSDISISRVNGGNREWWTRNSANATVRGTVFGVASDIITPGDYTGDGATDIALWRPATGEWFILRSENSTFFAFPFGAAGDKPAPADYDGDGKFDAAVYRPTVSTWFISKSSGGTDIRGFGINTDSPIPRDFDGDNKADLAVYRANGANQEWWISKSTGGTFATVFGTTGDKAVPADYTGDGKVDVAVWRPSNGNWFILRSEDLSFFAFPFGTTGDIPAPGDYDGDGKYDQAIFRPSAATWFINNSTASSQIIGFGAFADIPWASANTP